jgi:hypothetical protein
MTDIAANGEFFFAFLAIPLSTVGAVIGFLALNRVVSIFYNITMWLKSSDVELLRQTLYPPFKAVTSPLNSAFGKSFTPNATHVLLGALIIVLVLTRARK